MLKKVFDFFVFSNLFIAVCAVVITRHTASLFNRSVDNNLLYFIFSGALCSYSFHWYFTPNYPTQSLKTKWSIIHKKLLLAFFFCALLSAFFFSYWLLRFWDCLLFTAVLPFIYSAPKIPYKPFSLLKNRAYGKTFFLASAWTHITVILPLVLAQTEWQTSHYLFAVHRFFFIYAICILFDYRDIEEDRKENIKSLTTSLDDRGVKAVFWSCLIISFASGMDLPVTSFPLTTVALLIIPVIIVALLYSRAVKKPSDYLYYFTLDGLMMLSGLLHLISSI